MTQDMSQNQKVDNQGISLASFSNVRKFRTHLWFFGTVEMGILAQPVANSKIYQIRCLLMFYTWNTPVMAYMTMGLGLILLYYQMQGAFINTRPKFVGFQNSK